MGKKSVTWGQRSIILLFPILLFSCSKPAEQKFSITPLNEKGIVSLLADAKGKVVLINLWASWCDPCKKEFPDLVKLREAYSAHGLEVMFIATDDEDQVDAHVRPFLLAQKVSFPTYIKNTSNDEEFINSINKEWSGALPATFIYDKTGKQVRWWLGEQEYSFFEKVIQPLL